MIKTRHGEFLAQFKRGFVLIIFQRQRRIISVRTWKAAGAALDEVAGGREKKRLGKSPGTGRYRKVIRCEVEPKRSKDRRA